VTNRIWTTGLALALAVPAISAPAAAQNLGANNPAAIAAVLQQAGYRAEITKDASNDPMIRSAAGGKNFQVLFYGCTNNKDCTTVQFYAAFAHKGVTLEKINNFNKRMRWARVYLDNDADPVIEMDLNMDEGGIARANFRDNLDVWASVFGSFVSEFEL